MTTLRNCPFCGGKAEIERQGSARQSTIYACTECGCRLETGEVWSVPERWNTRAPDPRITAAKALADATASFQRWQIPVSDALRLRSARAALLKALEAGDA